MTEHCGDHSGHNSRLVSLETSDNRQWAAIDKLQNRPPVWATVVIAVLSAAVAWFAKG